MNEVIFKQMNINVILPVVDGDYTEDAHREEQTHIGITIISIMD